MAMWVRGDGSETTELLLLEAMLLVSDFTEKARDLCSARAAVWQAGAFPGLRHASRPVAGCRAVWGGGAVFAMRQSWQPLHCDEMKM